MFMFLNQGSKAVDHLFNIYDNVSELESMNEELTSKIEDIEVNLSEIVNNTSLLSDVEANTSDIKKNTAY